MEPNSDIIGYLFNFINILDIIPFSRITKRINNLYNQTNNLVSKQFIDSMAFYLKSIKYIYDQNTKPETYKFFSENFQAINQYCNSIKDNFDEYLKLSNILPSEYFILLKLLCYYKIPTINIIDISIIINSIAEYNKNKNNLIPLFFLKNDGSGLLSCQYAPKKITISTGFYFSYNIGLNNYSACFEDPTEERQDSEMIVKYGLISIYNNLGYWEYPFINISCNKNIILAFGQLLYFVYFDAINFSNKMGNFLGEVETDQKIKKLDELEKYFGFEFGFESGKFKFYL